MVRCLVVAVAGLSACGRLQFDERAATVDAALDVALGHDEDGDGIVDGQDPCPHLAGDGADRDRDGVGDACDPAPDAPTSAIVVFSTMRAGDQPFASIGAFDQEDDAIHTAANTGMSIFGTFATLRVDIGFEIRAVVGTGQHQIASGIDGGSGSVYYFAELNENLPLKNASIVSFDNVNGYVLLDGMTHAGMRAGVGLLRYDANAATASYQMVAGWTNELYTASASTPMYSGGTEIRVVLNGLDIAITYVALIATF